MDIDEGMVSETKEQAKTLGSALGSYQHAVMQNQLRGQTANSIDWTNKTRERVRAEWTTLQDRMKGLGF